MGNTSGVIKIIGPRNTVGGNKYFVDGRCGRGRYFTSGKPQFGTFFPKYICHIGNVGFYVL